MFGGGETDVQPIEILLLGHEQVPVVLIYAAGEELLCYHQFFMVGPYDLLMTRMMSSMSMEFILALRTLRAL